MSLTISYNHDVSGDTLYAILRDSTGLMWHVANADFEAFTGTTADHALAMTAGDLGNYHYDLAANFPVSSVYSVEIFQQTGGSPSDTFGVDHPVHSSSFTYASDIAAEVTDLILYGLGLDGAGGGGGSSGTVAQTQADILKYVKAILSDMGRGKL